MFPHNKQSSRPKITADQVTGVLKHAQVFQSQGRFNDAIDLCEQILESGYDRADVRYLLGWLYQEQERWHDAIKQFQLLLDDLDYALSCYYALGQCYRSMGDLRTAVMHFDEAVDRVNLDALTIKDVDQLIMLCQEAVESHRALGEQEQAVTIYNALLGYLRGRGWNDKVIYVESLLQQIQLADRVPSVAAQPLPPTPQPSVVGELPEWLKGILSDEEKAQVIQKPPTPFPLEAAMGDEELQNLLSSTQLPADTILKARYRILTRLGKGGMGAVYKAKDTAFNDRFVAVKQMLQTGLAPQMLTVYSNNFKREANLLAGLMHRSLPRIYDYFSEGECWYLVMDYIEGASLQKHLEQAGGRLSIEEALRIGIELCTVLGYLHRREPSIIFRDLKPANVIITPESHIYLIDFGIARQFKPEQLKDTHHFVSAGYAAPEQYGHGQKQTTPQSDVYSLGATLHQVLSGDNPAETPFVFSQLKIGVPELETLIHKMLEMNPINRPASTEVIKQALQRMLVQVQSSAKPTPAPIKSMANPGQAPALQSQQAQERLGCLRIVEGKEPGRQYELRKEELTIGRDRDRDIFLEDLAVSRLHVKVIKQSNGMHAIRDEGSANGTKLNGQRMNKYQTYPLHEGDRFTVGNTLFDFTYVQPPFIL